MSARGGGKRQRVNKGGGRKRKGGSSSSSSPASTISIATCEGHAATLLSRVDALRRSHPGLCDLRIRPSSGQGAEVPVHSLIWTHMRTLGFLLTTTNNNFVLPNIVHIQYLLHVFVTVYL